MIAVRLKPAPRGRQRVDANGKLTLRPESVTDRSSRPSSRLSDTLQPRGDIDAGSRQVAVGLSPTLPKWMPTRNSIHLSGATPGPLAIAWICLLINRQPPHALLGARSALTESKGIPRGRESDSTCWLGLEASGDGASLFFGPAGACGGGGRGGSVLPFGGQDVHGQRRQRCEVVAAPARRRQSGRAEDGRSQALPCGARARLGSGADLREAGSHAARSPPGAGRPRPGGQLLCALAFSAA